MPTSRRLPFQSTLPVWGATASRRLSRETTSYFNPRSPCGERRGCCVHRMARCSISIHAPRVGSDGFVRVINLSPLNFNPRSPCGERLARQQRNGTFRSFQSTLPVWGATTSAWASDTTYTISIHAPRVGSDISRSPTTASNMPFQSTLPVWGATRSLFRLQYTVRFQSTLPVWGATALNLWMTGGKHISIHAPRVGSDMHQSSRRAVPRYFNPRSPCGERH